MTDEKPTIIISPSEPRPDIPTHDVDACPHCGGPVVKGFGLAGGGFGPYTFCEKCERITSKINMPDDF